MNRYSAIIASIILLVSALAGGCSGDSTIGLSIVQDVVSVTVDSSFTLSAKTVEIEKVQSRTTSQLLGRFQAEGFGKFESNVVTQFMPSSSLDTTNFTDIDSLMLYMYIADGDLVGDSLVPMGLNLYELTELLPSPIYSNFDPTGYYDPNNVMASVIYNLSHTSNYLFADTVYESGLEIAVKMPDELAYRIYDRYKENSSSFASPTAFANDVFKGLYIENSFGSGRLCRSSSTMMCLYYNYTYYDDDLEADTTIHYVGNYLAVSPEIVTNNDIDIELSQSLLDKVDEGQQIIAGPVGLEVQIRFPTPEIIAALEASDADITVLNTLTMDIPAETITNDYNIDPPQYVLLVLTKHKDDFFANNELPDDVTSFYAEYDSNNYCYSFSDMRSYLTEVMSYDTIQEEDYTFTLTPVTATFETSSSSYYYYYTTSTLSMMTPYMATPAMARILTDDAKIKLTFSASTIE